MMLWSEWFEECLRKNGSPYAEFFHAGLEMQFQPTEDEKLLEECVEKTYPYRIPKDGKTDPKPNDCQPGYNPDLVEAAGTSWWDWRNELTEGSAFDFDFAHGGHGLDELGIQQIDLWAKRLPYVMNCTSKGGEGRHWLIRLKNPLPARTRVEHLQNCKAIKDKIAADLGVNLDKYICSFGGIQYIHATQPAENGFKLLKKATEKLDVPPPEFVPPKPDNYECVALNPAHREHKAWLEGKGFAEWDEHAHGMNTHTAALALLYEHFDMKGDFSTAATGKDLPNDRNCIAYPMKGGAWRIVRYNNGPEPGWDKTKNGNSTCVLNKAARKEKTSTDTIVTEALALDKFFHWQGFAYVEVQRHGRSETLLVGSDAYARLLRVRHRNNHHQVAKRDWIRNAVDHLISTSIEEGPEIPIYVRIAYIDDQLIIDLADRDRNMVIIDKDGWRVVSEAPVRFLHSEKMRPLPIPEHGGSLLDLKPFVNVADEDFPLLIGAIIGMFHPTGPYPVINLIGGDGRAKTCVASAITKLVDPSLVKGCCPPDNSEDLILSVLQRWVYFIDNLSDMKSWLSDTCCRVSTGGALERRTKYTDRETSAFVVKRPQLITSIRDVITHPDLISRTLKFDLPRVENRKPEKELWEEYKKARPKILGALYTAISAAIRNLPNTKISDLPRLADFAVWCQAAEEATGLVKDESDKGIILRTYRQSREAIVDEILSADSAQKILAFASSNEWTGTGKELTEALELGFTKDQEIKDFIGELRTMQTALESKNVSVTFGRSHGRKKVSIKQLPSLSTAV